MLPTGSAEVMCGLTGWDSEPASYRLDCLPRHQSRTVADSTPTTNFNGPKRVGSSVSIRRSGRPWRLRCLVTAKR